MKRDRKDLVDVLYQAIKSSKESGQSNKIIEYLEEKLWDHKIDAGKVSGMYDRGVPFETLNKPDLYLFTKYLFEATNYTSIKIDKWFTDDEILEYDQYQEEKLIKNNEIVLHDVSRASDYEFICAKITYQEMANISNQGLLYYNDRTQRQSNYKKFDDGFYKKPYTDFKKIDDMVYLMKEDNFEPNTLVLNIRKIAMEKQNFSYIENQRDLPIRVDNKKTFLDIIDGFHRWQAAVKAISENPNCKGYFHLQIFNFSEQKAQSFLAREEKATPMKIEHVEAMDNTDIYVVFTKEFDEDEYNNDMHGKIAFDISDRLVERKYITVSDFSKALKHNYDFSKFENRDIMRLKRFLKEFFNELLGALSEKYTNENSIIFESASFVGYIALSSILFDNENWYEELHQILNKFDFSNDYDWNKIGIFDNKSNVKKISEFFKEVGGQNV